MQNDYKTSKRWTGRKKTKFQYIFKLNLSSNITSWRLFKRNSRKY